jgi:hypothetical protein
MTIASLNSVIGRSNASLSKIDSWLSSGQLDTQTAARLTQIRQMLVCTVSEFEGMRAILQNLSTDLSEYGITITPSAFPGEQYLILILDAVQQTATRLKSILQSSPLPCRNYADLTSEEIFSRVFGDVDIRYNPDLDNPYSNVDDQSLPNTQILTLSWSAFVNTQQFFYPDELTKDIVVHEFGHVFHNQLKKIQGDIAQYPFATPNVTGRIASPGIFEITIPQVLVGTDEYQNYLLWVAQSQSPLVTIDYLTETGGYWTGDTSKLDFGDQRTVGSFVVRRKNWKTQ